MSRPLSITLSLLGLASACSGSSTSTDAAMSTDAIVDTARSEPAVDLPVTPPDDRAAPDVPTVADVSGERVAPDVSDDRAPSPDAAPDASRDAPFADRTDDAPALDGPSPHDVVPASDAPASDRPACEGGACAPVQRSCLPLADGSTPPGCGVVRVSGGAFAMGVPMDCRTPGAPRSTCVYDASPEQTDVTVGSFTMDAHEVTVARFRAFWRARMADDGASLRARPVRYPSLDGTTPQETAWGTAMGSEPPTEAMSAPCNWSREPSARDGHPINCVTWWTAQEFCVWDRGEASHGTAANGRLPTEAEWEYAARGRSLAAEGLAPGRTYPWGTTDPDGDDMMTCTRAQWNRCPGADGALTRRVGSFAASGGLFDLAGNVDEWTADLATAYMAGSSANPCVHRSGRRDPLCQSATTVNRVVRGGSHLSFQSAFLRSAARAYNGPGFAVSVIGFRCVATTE